MTDLTNPPLSMRFLIRRRVTGDAGPPDDLLGGELAHNEPEGVLYAGVGDDGTGRALSVDEIGGRALISNATLDAVTPAMFGGNADDAAEFAYSEGRPLYIDNDTATVDLAAGAILNVGETQEDANHRVLMEALRWLGKCSTRGEGVINFRLPLGQFKADAWDALGTGVPILRHYGTFPAFNLNPYEAGTEHLISSITYGTRTGDVYPVTVVLTTALGAHVVPGYSLGLKNITGDNDAGAITGGMTVATISGDRLTVTGSVQAPRSVDLVSPTTINTAVTWYGMAASRLVVPASCLTINTKYVSGTPVWTGANYEGYFNVSKGGRINLNGIGISWAGSSGTAHDFAFIDGAGSECLVGPGTVLVGAPAFAVRSYGYGCRTLINQACIGGGATGRSGVVMQAGAGCEIIRSNIGGFSTRCMTFGDGCKATVSITAMGSAAVIAEAVGAGASLALATTKLEGGARGIYAVYGDVSLGTSGGSPNVTIGRCATPIDWLSEGFIRGPANLVDNESTPVANEATNGGGWYSDTTIGLAEPNDDPTVELLHNQTASWPLTGTGGRITLVCQNGPSYGFEVDVHVSSPVTVSEIYRAGSGIVEETGTLTSVPVNIGLVSVSVYLSSGTYYLAVLNETGAPLTWRIKPTYGLVTMGTVSINGAATTVGSNILAHPRAFNEAGTWATGGSGATVTANAATSPDLEVMADKLDDTLNSIAQRRQQAVAVTIASVYEASLCLKKSTAQFAALEITGETARVVIDLDTGDFIETGFDTAVVTDLGDGWYRIVTRYVATAATSTFRVYPAYAGSLTQTTDGSITGAVFADLASLALVT